MGASPVKVTITFTEQQIELLEKLIPEGRFGDELSAVVANVFHEYVRAFLGRGPGAGDGT